MIGRTIGRFRITAPLGKGGMAAVWRARDSLLGRDLALKILDENLAQVTDSRRRFRHEAIIASRLDHPGIAAVYDSGESDGFTWIAMALIEGRTLSERLLASLPSVRDVVGVAIAVADALEYAHGHAVVHRDITSRNVMLANDGRVFVLDFGLALAADTSRISTSGTTHGTAHYMAPEVFLGQDASARSDLYGLGAVIYEALTGTVPFAQVQPIVAAFATVHHAPRPPRELRPEVPAKLEEIVLRCIEKDPFARYASAAELAADLRRVQTAMKGGAEAAPDVDAASPPAQGDAPAPPRVAEHVPTPRSGVAAHLATGAGPVYLAVPRFSTLDHDEASDVRHGELARGLTTTVAAGLAQLQRVHVVSADEQPVERTRDGLREYARSLGVQLLLLGSVRKSGTRLRVTVALLDPEAAVQIAGDTLEGSLFDVFELEDRLLAALRKMVAREQPDSRADTRKIPRDPAAAEHFQQAIRYMERYDSEASVDEAIAILERLVMTEGDSAEVHAALARGFLFKYELTRQRSWEARAASAASRAVELAPVEPATLLAVAELHRVSGRLEQALSEFERALEVSPGHYEAQLGRARALEDLGRADDASAACEGAVATRPEDWRGHSLLGWMRFTHGHYSDALPPWRRVLEMVPDSARAERNVGTALFHLDRFEEAISHFRRSLEIQLNASAFTNLGTALFFLSRHAEAAEAFEKGAALAPSDSVTLGNLGNALRLTQGRESEGALVLERAVGMMRERLSRGASDSESWARLAGWLANLGRKEEAIEAIGRALEGGRNDVHCMVRAGHVYLQVGDRSSAIRWIRTALEHGYGARALLNSPELSELLNDPELKSMLNSHPNTSAADSPDERKEPR